MAGCVVWCDIPVKNISRAIRFYSAVLKVKIKKETGPGFELAVLPHSDGGHGIGCCLYTSKTDKPHRQGARLYFTVEGRLDAACKAIVKHKGKILQPKHAIGEHGFRAVVLDSEGNRIALHSMK